MKKICTLALTTTLVLASSLTWAEDGPHDKSIKARQALMQIYSYHMGILGGMAKGKVEYNAELATEAANNLLGAASMGQSTLWPAGSDDANDANRQNRALPALWETYPEVAEKGKAFNEAVVAMAGVAGNGLDALKDAVGSVGKGCKGCHDDFRAEKK